MDEFKLILKSASSSFLTENFDGLTPLQPEYQALFGGGRGIVGRSDTLGKVEQMVKFFSGLDGVIRKGNILKQ